MMMENMAERDSIVGKRKAAESDTAPSDAPAKDMSVIAEGTKENKPKTHLDNYFDRLDGVLDRVGAKGSLLEQGIPSKDENDEKKAEEDYTEEEVAQLRHIIITDRREKMLMKYEKLILGDQYGDNIVMFNTRFSYEIFDMVPRNVRRIMKMKSSDEKYDNLMTLTKSLLVNDTWMHDYEDSEAFVSVVKQLGNAWKKLLLLSDQELGIDSEFTRPATEKLLEHFAEDVATSVDKPNFKWK